MKYSDFDYQFLRNPNTNDVRKLTDQKSIEQSLKNLIQTARGERMFDSNIGVADGLGQMLFENLNDIAKLETTKEDIKVLIRNYEQRVDLLDVELTSLENELSLKLVYKIKNDSGLQLETNIFITK